MRRSSGWVLRRGPFHEPVCAFSGLWGGAVCSVACAGSGCAGLDAAADAWGRGAGRRASPDRIGAAGTLHDTVSALARVSADLSRTVVIRTSGDGKVTAVRVTPGQTVVPGQALIDYTDHSLHVLHLQLEQDEAALASAKATLGRPNCRTGAGSRWWAVRYRPGK